MYVKNLNERQRREMIKKLFIDRYKINLENIKENDNNTPDFEYIKDGKRIFVMELKTLKWLSISEKEEKGYKKDESGWLIKKDNNPSKIAHVLKRSHPQLMGYKEPKILAYLNESNDYDFLDLTSALTGKITFYDNNNPADQETFNLYKHIANGDIKEKKKDIDLYIWIETPDGIRKFDFEINFLPINTKGEYIFNQYFMIRT